jgi:hypothetical protein
LKVGILKAKLNIAVINDFYNPLSSLGAPSRGRFKKAFLPPFKIQKPKPTIKNWYEGLCDACHQHA